MKIFLLTLLLGLSLSSRAQDINDPENEFLGFIYQQQGYQLDDPRGDILLLWTAHQIPKFVLKNLSGKQSEYLKIREQKIQELLKKYPEYSVHEEKKNVIIQDYVTYNPEHEPIQLEGHKAPFKIKNVVQMMKQVITEEFQDNGIIPQEGSVHKWSQETKKAIRKKFPLFSRMSKLLVALSRGGTSSYMVSGSEEELKDYIISRPENSINLEEMFRASYRINKGDVYLTLLTVENVLSKFWLVAKRDKRLITTKLKDITNYNYKTDKFGSWYHLFGMMLYGYAEGGLTSRIVGNVETAGSLIMSRFKDERQETYINSRGGPIGARVKKFIKKKEYLNFERNEDYLNEDFYMDLDEDFSKRLEKAKKKKQVGFLSLEERFRIKNVNSHTGFVILSSIQQRV